MVAPIVNIPREIWPLIIEYLPPTLSWNIDSGIKSREAYDFTIFFNFGLIIGDPCFSSHVSLGVNWEAWEFNSSSSSTSSNWEASPRWGFNHYIGGQRRELILSEEGLRIYSNNRDFFWHIPASHPQFLILNMEIRGHLRMIRLLASLNPPCYDCQRSAAYCRCFGKSRLYQLD